MKILAFLKKTFLENIRDWKILLLTLLFAPSFVYLMWGYFSAATPAYKLLVDNQDNHQAGNATFSASQGLIDTWRAAKHPDGKPMFVVTEVNDSEAAKDKLKQRDADLLVKIPDGFSRSFIAYQQDHSAAPAQFINVGDQANLRSAMAMAMADYIAFGYAFVMTGATVPLKVNFEDLGGGQSRSPFDLYVPVLLMFSLIMVLFSAATSLIKEVDKGTMSRLMLSNLGTGQFVFAISLNQMLIGISAMGLTYLSALSVGYTSSGSLITLFVVGAISTLAVVAVSVLVAAFLSSVFELLTIGCFPFFLLVLFSDGMVPLPKVDLFSVAGNMLYATDILPTSFTVRALNKILNHGAGLTDIAFELAAIAILTAGYFVLGSWLFRRRHQCVN